jgi:hypothetical protein
VLDAYPAITDGREKNFLVKSVIEKAEYIKAHGQKESNFELYLLPKIKLLGL